MRLYLGRGPFSVEDPRDLANFGCPPLAIGSANVALEPAAVDMNGDGVKDWTIAYCADTTIGTHWGTVLGDRSRAFTTVTSSTPGGGLVFFDADPLPDRYRIDPPVGDERESRVSIWRGVGPGAYSARPELFTLACPIDREVCATSERPEAFLPNHFDLDRDGNPELVRFVGSTAHRVDAISIVELASQSTAHLIDEGVLDIVLLGLAELDGDGTPEIVLGGYKPRALFLRGVRSEDSFGRGPLDRFATSELPVVSDANAYGAVVGDFDGDGNKDIMSLCDNGLCRQEGHGDGTFSPNHRIVEQIVPDGGFGAIRLGRFDRDGRDDFYFFDSIHRSGSQDKLRLEGCTAVDVAIVDVDRDGLDEMVATCAPPNGTLFFDHLDGTPRSRSVQIDSDPLDADSWNYAELDGDGIVDAVVSNVFETRIMHGVADSNTIHFVELAVLRAEDLPDYTIYNIAIRDVDGDGDLDVLVFGPGGSTAHILTNDAGSFTFTSRAFDSSLNFFDLSTCDLGELGRPSLITAGLNHNIGIVMPHEGEPSTSILLPTLAPSLFLPQRLIQSLAPTSPPTACPTCWAAPETTPTRYSSIGRDDRAPPRPRVRFAQDRRPGGGERSRCGAGHPAVVRRAGRGADRRCAGGLYRGRRDPPAPRRRRGGLQSALAELSQRIQTISATGAKVTAIVYYSVTSGAWGAAG